MAIHIQCDCGRSFSVPDEMDGRRAKCKACGNILQFPPPAAAARPVPVAVPIAQPPSPRPATSSPVAPKPISAQASAPIPAKPEAEKALAYFNEATRSQAANPGKLAVNPFLYLRAYPGGLLFGGCCVVASVLVTCLYPPLFVLVLASIWLCWKLWFPVRFHFIGGNIRPGVVVSVDPPRVAVFTNLGRVEGTPAVIVEKHPLKYLLGGMPQVGQRVPAVVTYCEREQYWDDCVPKLPGCVTRDRAELERIHHTIPEADWQELERGLRQIPPPLDRRAYRIFSADVPPPTDAWLASNLEQLVQEVLSHVPDKNQYVAAYGIPGETMKKAQEEIAEGIDASEILAICGGMYFLSGFVMTRQGLVVGCVDYKHTFFRWQDVRGALFCAAYFEITRRDFSRMHVGVELPTGQAFRVESLINSIAISDRDGWRP